MMRFDKTILQIIPRLDGGGAERMVVEISGAIVRAGGRALVASAGGRLAQDVERVGGAFLKAPVQSKNPATLVANISLLKRLIAAHNVDIVHVHSRAPAWSALFAARGAGVPLVTSYHGAYRARGPLKRWYNSSMARGDCVIANSRFIADIVRAEHGVGEDRIRVIPPGADLSVFDPKKVSPARVAKLVGSWRLPDDGSSAPRDFRILFPGRPTRLKGHAVAIDAVAQFAARLGTGHDLELTLVFCGGAQGRNRYADEMRAKVEEYGVSDMVHWVGECADMPAAYDWADLVLAPSTRPEGFGRVAVEAGAMCRPVVASAHGGALETVIDGENGYLATPGDARALSDAIEKVWRLGETGRRTMGEKARARARSLYSAETMCDATLMAYTGAASKKGGKI
ncbi:MAG: glycosyltransferase family 4 protein [Pseudomonadota bacterium]